MKTKREQQEQMQGVEDSVVNLGFVKNLAQDMSANQLAASGIQLSMRANLIKFIQNMDQGKRTQNEEKLLTALQNSQTEQKEGQNELKPVSSGPEIEKPKEIVQETLPQEHHDSESDEGGLVFYDPQAEERARKEKELLENQRNRANLLKDQGAANSGVAAIAAQSSLLNVKQVNQRSNFLNSLKNKQKQKNVMTLERVKATFQSTDFFNDDKKKKKTGADGVDDPLEDRDSDSDFDEQQALNQ